MGQRRDKGSGSITYDTNADRWVARLNLGITPAGKRVRVKATAPTRAEARRKLEQLRDKHLAGVDLTQRHQTVSELVELWLARGLATTSGPGRGRTTPPCSAPTSSPPSARPAPTS